MTVMTNTETISVTIDTHELELLRDGLRWFYSEANWRSADGHKAKEMEEQLTAYLNELDS